MSVIQDVKDAVGIVDVVGRYVELRQVGSSFKGHCPFHQERTPSFYVWPERQLWRCFGACSEGGDVIAFLMKAENLDFPEALRSLAAEGGVPLASRAGPPKQDVHAPLYRLLGQAAAYFRQNLLQEDDRHAQKARAYLTARQISPAVAAEFEIGLSLWDRTGLVRFMGAQGYRLEDLHTVDLIIRQENDVWRDRFLGRLMLPIRNVGGRVIGFGARQLPPESEEFGKYINTASTPLFHKSTALYGIDKAKDAIRRNQQAVIVEGYFDVIAAHQHGHTNTVACMGTAVTPDHIQLLQRWTSKITFALDADVAGQRATVRNLDRSRQALQAINQGSRRRSGAQDEVQLTIVKVPQGQDPDELIRTNVAAWPRLVQADMSLVDFYAEYLSTEYDFDQPEQKQKAAFRMVDILSGFAQPITREGHIVRAAHKLQIAPGLLQRMVQDALSHRRFPQRRSAAQGKSGRRPVQPQVPRKEDWLLGTLCWNPQSVLSRLDEALAGIRLAPLSRDDFTHSENVAVYEALTSLAPATEAWQPQALRRHLDADLHPHLELLEGIARKFRNNDSQEVSHAALEHLLGLRTRSVHRNLELLNISEDTSSVEGARRTQRERKQLYASRRFLDEARDRVQHRFVGY